MSYLGWKGKIGGETENENWVGEKERVGNGIARGRLRYSQIGGKFGFILTIHSDYPTTPFTLHENREYGEQHQM